MSIPALSKALLTITFGLTLTAHTFALPSAANQSNQPTTNRQGLPGRRISGGVREGNCFRDFNQSLVAIMPRNNLGKTALERPTFWFSLPLTEGEERVEFQLFDSADEMVYDTLIDVGDSQGLSEFQLPAAAPALAVDNIYRWTFSIGCTDSSQFVVQGWIQRVDIPRSVAAQLKDASLEEQAALYSSAGFWHEQVTALVNLRRSDPTNAEFQMEWAEMLATTGLTSHVSSRITNAADAMSVVTASPSLPIRSD